MRILSLELRNFWEFQEASYGVYSILQVWYGHFREKGVMILLISQADQLPKTSWKPSICLVLPKKSLSYTEDDIIIPRCVKNLEGPPVESGA